MKYKLMNKDGLYVQIADDFEDEVFFYTSESFDKAKKFTSNQAVRYTELNKDLIMVEVHGS